jgi:A/G-specific adenine glycosylase
MLGSIEDLQASAPALAEALSAWFSVHQRALPWRGTRSPYRVWLSEIMLQQTQVATVIPYFERFLARFPTVDELAAADVDEVLSLWSGLGYYRRGRNLHRAARVVAARGGFPDDVDGLLTLPGVGAYSAGAIASFAFGRRAPLVDGNVHRVVSRLLDDSTPIDSLDGKRLAWSAAAALVEAADDPAALNEGLMELGALVCTPRAPRCESCPWLGGCAAQAAGTAEELPVKLKRPKRRPLRVATVVLTRAGDIWLERTEGEGLFGGLWAPPAVEVTGDRAPEDAWAALLIARRLTPRSGWPEPIRVARTLTHRDLTLEAAPVELPAGDEPCLADVEGRWVDASTLAGVGTSAAVRALISATL